MTETASTLRAELRRCRPAHSHQGFPHELRLRAGRWLRQRQRDGAPWTTLAWALGLSPATARKWALAAESTQPPREGGFVAVVVEPEPLEGPVRLSELVLVSPEGYRVTGLQPQELIVVLRGLR